MRLARAFGGSERAATYASVLLVATPLLLLLSRQFSPEVLGALCLVHLARRLAEAGPGQALPGVAVVNASAAAALAPWFDDRYRVVAGALATGLVWRTRRVRTGLVLAALGVSGPLLRWAMHGWYGSFSPNAAYAGADRFGGVSLRALVGFFVDSHVGLLFVAPLALVSLAWLPAVVRARPDWAVPVLAGVAVTLVSTSAFFDWAGGGRRRAGSGRRRCRCWRRWSASPSASCGRWRWCSARPAPWRGRRWWPRRAADSARSRLGREGPDAGGTRWALRDSNPRPPACKAGALTS